MSNIRRYFFEISLFILLFLVVFLFANINVDKFFQSHDFEANISLLSNSDIGIEKALIYPLFNSLLLPIIEPVTFLLLAWSLIPTILIYFTTYIIRKLLKDIEANKSYILILMFSSVCFYFSLSPMLFKDFILTAHLLLQSLASVFFLLALWYWHDNRKYSILFFTISLSMHYVATLYLLILFITNYIHKNRFSWLKLFGASVTFIFSYYVLILGYSILRLGKLSPDEIPSMGVEDTTFIYRSILVAFLGFILLFFFRFVLHNLIKHKNIVLFIKKIITIYTYSLLLAVFSWMVSFQFPGMGYRIGFLVYVLEPLLISLLPVIGILLLGGILKTTGNKKIICFQ
jgi:hypothetical protein